MLLFLFSGYLHARDEEDIFSGYYAYGFEESRFSPVGSKERWWLDKLPPCVEQAEKASGGTPILFIEVVGKLSSVGKFGHLGKYPRELVVKQDLPCRKLSPGEGYRLPADKAAVFKQAYAAQPKSLDMITKATAPAK